MFGRFFNRTPAPPDLSAWWRDADLAASSPSAGIAESLRAGVVSMEQWPDQAEAQVEMLDALEALVALAAAPELPTLATQHRVIGTDACHFIAPATLGDAVDGGGKVFLTTARMVFASGSARGWAWHQIAKITRQHRDLHLQVRGVEGPLVLRLNSYEHAVCAAWIAARLRA